MSGFLSVTNWTEYQHYRDRTPTWIKFYVDILHDEKLKKLPIHSRLMWDQMLLLAATFQNSVPNSPEVIANLTGIPRELCGEAIDDLLKGRWIREKSTRRAASKQPKAQKRSKKEELEKNARARALHEAAQRYAVEAAHYSTDQVLEQHLRDDYGMDDELAIRRMIGEARSAA